jgi:hypothetical protein
VDALIRGKKILSFFHIDDTKGSGTDPGFDDRRDGNFVEQMVKALHHVGYRAALNLVGFRAKALNLTWFRGNLKCLWRRDPMGLCKLHQVSFIPDEFDFLQIRTEEVSISGDLRMIFHQQKQSLLFHREEAIVVIFFNLC